MPQNTTSMSILLIVGAEMYAGHVACCPLLSDGEYADETDGQTIRTDAGSLHYAFYIHLYSPIYMVAEIRKTAKSTTD